VFDVVGVGASSVDYVYRLPASPSFAGGDSKLRLVSRSVSSGGQVATAMTACARLGLRAAYAGAVGRDENGRRVLEALEAAGVDVSLVIHKDADNQFAVILVDDRTGERSVLWDRPDRLSLLDEELPAEALATARMVLVDDVDSRASLRAAELARAADVPVTTDLDHPTPHSEAIFRAATHPVLAEHMPGVLTGEADLERALRKLRASNAGLLTVTLGARGAAALDRDRFIHVDGFRVGAVDATGAGDVFRGAFIDGVLRGLSTEATLRWANATAAISCTRAGALDGAPSRADVEAFLLGL
jgi:sugar/nucleoside kinase (ribokinase family)